MVIMAIDHVRDYFHAPAFLFDPADPVKSDLPIFFTRWITHFCAPTFSFLAGMSAFMVGRKKTTAQLSGYLAKRGLWLVFAEVTIIGFSWFFDLKFRTFALIVIWALGMSMLVLSALVYLPRKYILVFSLLLIGLHNLLDTVHFPGNAGWSILHEMALYNITPNLKLLTGYPLVPWVAVMSLGYYFGAFYDKAFDTNKRKRLFNIIGFSAIAAFIVLRLTNLYGNPKPFIHYSAISQDIIAFLNPTKYPPSLQYLLMTLGAAFVFLANSESLKGRVVNFFCTFGRVPFFYYILHLYFIHITAMVFAQLSGFGWQKFILDTWIGFEPNMAGYGFRLWVVYLVWAGLILLLYPLCKRFDQYKQANKQKWWLSYL